MKEEQRKKMGQLIAKCWADEGFKLKLLADSAAAPRAEAIELPGLAICDEFCPDCIPAGGFKCRPK
jgi:hypothetical protein